MSKPRQDPDGSAPTFDVADRMRKALRESGVKVGEIADYLGVSRNTVGNYINGHTPPPKQTLRLWAMRCGVDYRWLTEDEWAPRGSNPQPTDYKVAGSLDPVDNVRYLRPAA